MVAPHWPLLHVCIALLDVHWVSPFLHAPAQVPFSHCAGQGEPSIIHVPWSVQRSGCAPLHWRAPGVHTPAQLAFWQTNSQAESCHSASAPQLCTILPVASQRFMPGVHSPSIVELEPPAGAEAVPPDPEAEPPVAPKLPPLPMPLVTPPVAKLLPPLLVPSAPEAPAADGPKLAPPVATAPFAPAVALPDGASPRFAALELPAVVDFAALAPPPPPEPAAASPLLEEMPPRAGTVLGSGSPQAAAASKLTALPHTKARTARRRRAGSARRVRDAGAPSAASGRSAKS
jgi:hypothetical protein